MLARLLFGKKPDPRPAYYRAQAAKMRLSETLTEVGGRMKPATLKEDATELARGRARDAIEHAKQWALSNPAVITAFGAAIGLYAINLLRTRMKNAETHGEAESLNGISTASSDMEGTE